MENKKQIILSLLILFIVIFAISIVFISQHNFALNNYKKQAISVLNDYKDGKINNRTASDKLDTLSERLRKEYEDNQDIGTMQLQIKVSLIALKTKYDEISNSEIKNYINEIKSIN